MVFSWDKDVELEAERVILFTQSEPESESVRKNYSYIEKLKNRDRQVCGKREGDGQISGGEQEVSVKGR